MAGVEVFEWAGDDAGGFWTEEEVRGLDDGGLEVRGLAFLVEMGWGIMAFPTAADFLLDGFTEECGAVFSAETEAGAGEAVPILDLSPP